MRARCCETLRPHLDEFAEVRLAPNLPGGSLPPGLFRRYKMKILIFQATPAFGNVEANLKVIENTCMTAAQLEADVAVFPELFVSGYNLGEKLHQIAEGSDGPIVSKLKQIAKTHAVALIAGYPEKRENKFYNSAVAVSARGDIIGHHNKVFLFGDQEKALFSAGSGFPVFEIAGRKCGLSICYDIEFPEVTRDMKRRGAEIVFVPTANMEPYFEVPTTLVRARALENGIAIAYANLCGSEGNQHYTGLSAIVLPDGTDLVRAGRDDAILVSDLGPGLKRNSQLPLSSQLRDLASFTKNMWSGHGI
jgi:5-aminopentanamidase